MGGRTSRPKRPARANNPPPSRSFHGRAKAFAKTDFGKLGGALPTEQSRTRKRGFALPFTGLNHGKRNIVLDMKEAIGRETVQYVRNIYKYYVAYKLAMAQRQATQKAREAVKGAQ